MPIHAVATLPEVRGAMKTMADRASPGQSDLRENRAAMVPEQSIGSSRFSVLALPEHAQRQVERHAPVPGIDNLADP
jgi:hypothetical protein